MSNESIVQQKTQQLRKELNKMPRWARDTGVSFYKSRFRAQGWLDKSFKPWPRRKRIDKRRPGRNILMDRNRLRNSIRGEVRGDEIIFGSDVPYAKIHNEGGIIIHPARSRIITHKVYKNGPRKGRAQFARNDGSATYGKKVAVKSYPIKIPQRQFMGDSAHLRKLITRKIETTVKTVFK